MHEPIYINFRQHRGVLTLLTAALTQGITDVRPGKEMIELTMTIKAGEDITIALRQMHPGYGDCANVCYQSCS